MGLIKLFDVKISIWYQITSDRWFKCSPVIDAQLYLMESSGL